jgi:hypothetical protein
VADGGLLVGGVTVAVTAEDTESRDALRLGDELRQFLEARRGRELVGPGKLLLDGDAEVYRAVLEEYERSARLTPASLEALQTRRDLGRYLLLARIDVDEIEKTHEETRDDQDDRVRFEVELLSRRHVGLSADVYDLDERRVVWSSSFDRRLQKRGRRFTHEALATDVTNAPIEELREIRDRIREVGYPDPPRRADVLQRLFSDLAEALPATEATSR